MRLFESVGKVALAVGSLVVVLGLATPAQAGPVLYGVTGDGGSPRETLFTIDTTTAAATFLLTLGAGADGETIGFNPSDGLMYHASGISDGDRAWESINLTTPAVVTSVQFTGPDVTDESLAMTWKPSTGTFLVSDRTNSLFSTTVGGVATKIGSTPENLKGLAFVSSTLYGAAVFNSTLYQLNPFDGSVNSMITVTMPGFNVSGMNGLTTNPDTNQLFAIVRTQLGDGGEGQPSVIERHLATLDPTTGVASDIGVITGGTGWSGIAFGPGTPAAVPEPTTLALFALGLAGLGWRRRLH